MKMRRNFETRGTQPNIRKSYSLSDIFPSPHGPQFTLHVPLVFCVPRLYPPHKCACAFFGDFSHTWLQNPPQDATTNRTSSSLSYKPQHGVKPTSLSEAVATTHRFEHSTLIPHYPSGVPSDEFVAPFALVPLRQFTVPFAREPATGVPCVYRPTGVSSLQAAESYKKKHSRHSSAFRVSAVT